MAHISPRCPNLVDRRVSGSQAWQIAGVTLGSQRQPALETFHSLLESKKDKRRNKERNEKKRVRQDLSPHFFDLDPFPLPKDVLYIPPFYRTPPPVSPPHPHCFESFPHFSVDGRRSRVLGFPFGAPRGFRDLSRWSKSRERLCAPQVVPLPPMVHQENLMLSNYIIQNASVPCSHSFLFRLTATNSF